MDQIESSNWFLKGGEGIIKTQSKVLVSTESSKQSFKPKKIMKKTTITIPKRLEKQKN